MPSLNDLDPDVLELYQALKNKQYKDCEEYLNTNPAELYNKKGFVQSMTKPKLPERKIWVDGLEVSDFIESDDYGL